MKALEKLILLYSYFRTKSIDTDLLKAFFGENYTDAPSYKDANHQVFTIKEKLERVMEVTGDIEPLQVEECLRLIAKNRSYRVFDDPADPTLLKEQIFFRLIRNLFFPNWKQESIDRFLYAYFILKYNFHYYLSYSENNSQFNNNLFFETLGEKLEGTERAGIQNKLAAELDLILEQKYLSGPTLDVHTLEERLEACQGSFLFIQLIQNATFSDDQCFQEYQKAYSSPNPCDFRYVITYDEGLQQVTLKQFLPPEQQEWYEKIEEKPENVAVVNSFTSLDQLAISVQRAIVNQTAEVVSKWSKPANFILPPDQRKIILFVAASPTDLVDLQPRKEFFLLLHALADELNLTTESDNYQIIPVFQSKVTDLTRAIQFFNPHFIHFVGHGSRSDGLYFENDRGEAEPIPVQAIARFFDLANKNIEAVLLNACYSQQQAEAIKQAEPNIQLIATTQQIRNEDALNFSRVFYQSLFSDKNVAQAFEQGKGIVQPNYGGTEILIFK
jgi:hypothetical protein